MVKHQSTSAPKRTPGLQNLLQDRMQTAHICSSQVETSELILRAPSAGVHQSISTRVSAPALQQKKKCGTGTLSGIKLALLHTSDRLQQPHSSRQTHHGGTYALPCAGV